MRGMPDATAVAPVQNETAAYAVCQEDVQGQRTCDGHQHKKKVGTHHRKRQRRHGDNGLGLADADQQGAEGGVCAASDDTAPDASTPVNKEAAALALLKQTGVQNDRAARALKEVAEQCAQVDAAGWAEEAQVWLACNAEFEEERDKLAEAMQASLMEAEQRRAQEAPLEERSPEELAKVFADSQLLRALVPLHDLHSLLQPPLKQQLVQYLQLEKRCKKWYLVSQHYFQQRASECALQVAATCLQFQGKNQVMQEIQGNMVSGTPVEESSAAAARNEDVPASAAAGGSEAGVMQQGSRCSNHQSSPLLSEQATARKEPIKGRVRRGRRGAKGKSQQMQQAQQQADEGATQQDSFAAEREGNGTSKTAPPQTAGQPAPSKEVPSAVADEIARFVSSCRRVVEDAVYAMPPQGAQAVPQLFTDAAQGASPEECCVELLDE